MRGAAAAVTAARCAVVVGLAVSCGKGLERHNPKKKKKTVQVTDIVLDTVSPSVVLPGSTLVLSGLDFYPELAGETKLYLDGPKKNDVAVVARFVDYGRMEVDWPGAASMGLSDGDYGATAHVETRNGFDGAQHVSNDLPVQLSFATTLTPRIDAVLAEPGSVNAPLALSGDGFLLGGNEGESLATISGCFVADDDPTGGCAPIDPVTLPGVAIQRDVLEVPFDPAIAGIRPGVFEGQVGVTNQHADGTRISADGALRFEARLRPPSIQSMTPVAASLGQYIDIDGNGFIGPGPGDYAAVTLLELDGTFSVQGGPASPTRLTLIPAFESGQRVRYVVNEEDELGRAVNVRTTRGTFQGTATPVTEFLDDAVEGSPVPVTLQLVPVRQVVWLRFLPSFVESLHHFGLRDAQDTVIERIVTVVERDYEGVNLDLRLDEPTDFALYSEVEVSGTDPNGIGLLGYDNTPGKDVGNLRLYDKIGGVNALTQLDGYPGYGGVFIESLFTFSAHPNGLAPEGEAADPAFDELFDGFRPDQGGEPVARSELASATVVTTTDQCPARGRANQVGCAVWALGSLVGTTVTHEIAHSLGLADPDGEGFHNTGDWADAIMDGGSTRTFRERAEVYGEGPGVFCQTNYDYLEDILPSDVPDPLSGLREDCY